MNLLLPQTPTVIGPQLAGVRLSPEEFDAFECWDENYRYELINGVLVVTPPPLVEERDPNEELGHLLRSYRKQHPQGKALDKTLPEHTVVTGANRRRADRVIWAGLGRAPNPVHDLPTILVEFVSEARRDWLRDYEEKRQEYLALNIGEYWIINRFARQMTVFRKDAAGPQEIVIAEHDTYRTPLLPGFELPLHLLLAVYDDWKHSS